MPVVRGLSAVRAALRARRVGESNVAYVVEYTAPYATFVHENLEMKLQGQPRTGSTHKGMERLYPNYWDPRPLGSSKFLERPARNLSKSLGKMVKEWVKAGASLTQAMYRASLFLLSQSQAMVPVDTGTLKKSGRVRKEKK